MLEGAGTEGGGVGGSPASAHLNLWDTTLPQQLAARHPRGQDQQSRHIRHLECGAGRRRGLAALHYGINIVCVTFLIRLIGITIRRELYVYFSKFFLKIG